jgi:hypothetical protein
VTLNQNSLEAGVASGTAATTTLSATGGNAFTSVTPGTGAITYDSAAAAHGSLGLTIAATASSACYVDWQGVAGSSNTGGFAVRFYLTIPTLPVSNAQPLINLRTAGGGTALMTLQLGTTGTGSHLFVTNDANAGATLGTTTGALSANTLYRVELRGTNPTATTGTLNLDVYAGDSTTPIAGLTLALTGVNNNTTSATGTCRIGRPSAIGSAFTYRLDDPAFQTGSNAAIGAYNPAISHSGTGTALSLGLTAAAATGRKRALGTTTAVSLSLTAQNAVGGKRTTGPGQALSVALVAGAGTGTAAITPVGHSGTGAALTLSLTVGPPVGHSVLPSDRVGAATTCLLTLGTGPAVGRLLSMFWTFRPPTQRVWLRLAGHGLFAGYDQGLSVYRRDGAWHTTLSPSAMELTDADRYYAGGYEHKVTRALRDELIAGGYAAYLDPQSDVGPEDPGPDPTPGEQLYPDDELFPADDLYLIA